jgi:hypothetical protein
MFGWKHSPGYLHAMSIQEVSPLLKEGAEYALKKGSLPGEGNGKEQAHH